MRSRIRAVSSKNKNMSAYHMLFFLNVIPIDRDAIFFLQAFICRHFVGIIVYMHAKLFRLNGPNMVCSSSSSILIAASCARLCCAYHAMPRVVLFEQVSAEIETLKLRLHQRSLELNRLNNAHESGRAENASLRDKLQAILT